MKASIQRVLFPTDFSDSSKYAKQYACAIAGSLEADLHVLHVVPEVLPVPGPDGAWLMPMDGKIMQQLIDESKLSIAKEMQNSGMRPSRILPTVEFGNIVDVILRFAQSHDIDLIVLGTHGRTGLSHALIGSVAEKVVRLAKCPVLTVHPEGLKTDG